jgi:predicted DNA-binding WGR domain protein
LVVSRWSLGKSIIAALPPTSYGKMGAMAKKKMKKFSAVQAVKALAREQIGAPPASRVVPNRREKRTEKHKPTLGKLLGEE